MSTSVIFERSHSNQGNTGDEVSTSGSAAVVDRRHDLDALRAIAMLLGIVLHAALSFTSIPWAVHDSQQSEGLHVLFGFIHGFRMPLFFMLSGFFTAMLWRKRGLASLVKHRFQRIFLPLVLGCLTIVPAMWAVSSYASRSAASGAEESALFSAVVSGDVELVRSELRNTDIDINAVDASSGSSPLCTAVFLGRTEIAELLIDAQANVDLANRDMATPLHIAAFMGRAAEAALLMEAGADVHVRDMNMSTPADVLATDIGTTSFIANSLGVQIDEESLLSGRREIAEKLGASEYLRARMGNEPRSDFPELRGLLFYLPVFMHLWFLWFLCLLVLAFLGYARIASTLRIESLPRWLVLSPISLLWLVPLTMLPQAFMQTGTFGPDPSIGLLPIPSVFAYYAIFFFFGAIYWETADSDCRLGGWWYVSLPLACLIVFPISFDWVTGELGVVPSLGDDRMTALVGNFLQAIFAWLMVSGSIGACRRWLSRESKRLRYISDASYWMYLVHLPIVILAQVMVRDMQVPAFLKFASITIAVSVILLVTYEYGVRYTPIGRLLNGPRTRSAGVA